MVDYPTARRRMVDNQLRTSNVTDRRILAAMEEVPRERFLPDARRALAYVDAAHDLGGGRFLAAPAPFARLLQLAEVEDSDSVLDVGAGSGYTVAVLARLAGQVTGIESDAGLVAQANGLLGELGVANASVVQGQLDGAGQRRDSFDVVMVEGAVAEVDDTLFGLLKDGGRLVALVSRNGASVAHVFVKSGDKVTARAEFNTAMPPLVAGAREVQFQF